MNDPILESIQGAIVNMHVSNPAIGAKLGWLKLQPSIDIRTTLKVDGDVPHYNTERAKSLTMPELKEALANAVGI